MPAHTQQGLRYKLNFHAISWASAMLYAIREINKDSKLLPGISIGYDIRDSCQVRWSATQQTLDYLLDPTFFQPTLDVAKYENTSCIERGNSFSTVFGVVGAFTSPLSTVTNNLLGVDLIPQVSYGSTSTSLSDPSHRSFLRTVPSDIHQADAIVDLLAYFDWTYVSVFVEDDEYGRIGLDETRKNSKKRKICLAGEIVFSEKMTARDFSRITTHLKRIGGKSHVVIIWASVNNAIGIMLESQRNNITNITWIGTEAWGTHNDLMSYNIKENIIGLEIPERSTPKYDQTFLRQSLDLNCANPWYTEYVLEKYQPIIPYCNLTCSEPIPPCRQVMFQIISSTLLRTKTDQILTAIYALAHGLHKALNCNSTSCPKQTSPLNYYSIYNHILHSEFKLPDSDRRVKFDDAGDILDVSYDFKFFYHSTKQFKSIGNWSSKGMLHIAKEKIEWGSQKQPEARCSKDCRHGYYRVNGSSPCCWSCARCTGNTITSGINKYKCKNCSLIQLAIRNHTQCVNLRRINMELFDRNTKLLLALAIFGVSCTIFVIAVFIKFWNTPIVKASSREMSCIQLVSILLLFAFPGLYFIRDSPTICMIQVIYFAFLHATFLSLILVKTYRLLLVFRERFTSVSKFLGNKYQIAFSYIFVLVITIAVALWFVYFPTQIQYDVNRDSMIYYTRCGDELIWFVTLAYLALLEITITAMAFRARKLPENFNEVQFIVFTMFTDIMVWLLVSLALYVSLDSLSFTVAFLHVNFVSNFCRLVILYGYRVRILLFFPELNSPEHFRRTAVGTTVTNFVKEVRRGDGTYKRSITSVVQLQDYHDSPSLQPMMRYSFSSQKQYDVTDATCEFTPLRLNDAEDSRLTENTMIAYPKTSSIFEFGDPLMHDELVFGDELAEFDNDSADESVSSSRALTPDVLRPTSVFQDIKKWVSSQFLSDESPAVVEHRKSRIPRSASADCLDMREVPLNRELLDELMKLKETTM